MSAPIGSKNALGNKGGGRKSLYDDKIRAAVVNGCWKFLLDEWPNFNQKQKLDISTKFCVKNIPQEIDMSSAPVIIQIERSNGTGNNQS